MIVMVDDSLLQEMSAMTGRKALPCRVNSSSLPFVGLTSGGVWAQVAGSTFLLYSVT
jgi:hypothetical protein